MDSFNVAILEVLVSDQMLYKCTQFYFCLSVCPSVSVCMYVLSGYLYVYLSTYLPLSI